LAIGRIVAAAVLGFLFLSASASAHAILTQGEPEAGSRVPLGKVVISFRFNSRIDRFRSRLALSRPDHSQVVLKISADSPPDLLQTSADLTMPGAYVVRWQVLAVDGHITRGDVPFTATDH
jgi:methionine-rich copper-binding protein CopC